MLDVTQGKLQIFWYAHAGTVVFEPGQPFNETVFTSAEELLWAFQFWQHQTLNALPAGHPHPGVILVHLLQAGLGNRLPSLVTGVQHQQDGMFHMLRMFASQTAHWYISYIHHILLITG